MSFCNADFKKQFAAAGLSHEGTILAHLSKARMCCELFLTSDGRLVDQTPFACCNTVRISSRKISKSWVYLEFPK